MYVLFRLDFMYSFEELYDLLVLIRVKQIKFQCRMHDINNHLRETTHVAQFIHCYVIESPNCFSSGS